MRQVFLEKGLIKVKQVCEPFLDDNLILISVSYSCISPGTEGATIAHAQRSAFSHLSMKLTQVLSALSTHGFEGTRALVKEKLSGDVQALGYACAGKVIAVGKKVSGIKVGDLVACAGTHYANHADIIAVPENLVVVVPDHQLLKQASLTALGAIALQGIRRAQIQLGETIAVIGLGILGQLTVQLAKHAGYKTVAFDLLDDRLALAKPYADLVLNPQQHNIVQEINFFTAHQGVDCTLITASSSSNQIIQQAMEITRKKGKVVLVGDVGLELKRTPFYQKEIDFLISCSYGPGRYDASYEQQGLDYPYAYIRWTEKRNMETFISLLEKKHVCVDQLITQEIPVEDAQEAYKKLDDKSALCIILSYSKEEKKIEQPIKENAEFLFKPAVKGSVRVGIVGAGGFAKIKLIPIISRIDRVKINAIVDTNISSSMRTSKVYQAKSFTHDEQLFDEDLVDVVLIASPHKYHCAQALNALKKGKAVFLEKPMVTDFDQLSLMKDYFKNNAQPALCVDYNRSFAPFIQKIKKVIVQRNTPLVIQYRMNAGFIPKDHWVQTEAGAGRIIGEACHIFDLFCFLTDASPVSISVETIKTTQEDLFSTDNFSVQFAFDDGSLCSLVYTSLGHTDLNKERMEIFFDGKTILLDDYKILQGFGLHASFNEKTATADKGHETLLNQFFDYVKNKTTSLPMCPQRLEQVAEITLIVDQLASCGGGEHELP